jgi:hypothetical protein
MSGYGDDERFDDEVDEEQDDSEGPCAKTSSGDADSIVDDED